MPANVYECMFILDSAKVSGNIEAADKQLRAILEKHGAEVLISRQWGDDRKFTYPIKKHKKGIYYLTYFSSEGKNLVPIERDFKLNESILRYLTLRIEEKMEETMIALARDPHALALQAVVEDPTDEFAKALREQLHLSDLVDNEGGAELQPVFELEHRHFFERGQVDTVSTDVGAGTSAQRERAFQSADTPNDESGASAAAPDFSCEETGHHYAAGAKGVDHADRSRRY